MVLAGCVGNEASGNETAATKQATKGEAGEAKGLGVQEVPSPSWVWPVIQEARPGRADGG